MELERSFERDYTSLESKYEDLYRWKGFLDKTSVKKELKEIQVKICQIAKGIFPELEGLGTIFKLKKQSVWKNRNPMDDTQQNYINYNKLIEMQSKVIQGLRDDDDLFEIELDDMTPKSKSKKLKKCSDSENSSLSSSQEIDEDFEILPCVTIEETDLIISSVIEEEILNIIHSNPILLTIAQTPEGSKWLTSLLCTAPDIGQNKSCTSLYQLLVSQTSKDLSLPIRALIEEASWISFSEGKPVITFQDDRMCGILNNHKPEALVEISKFQDEFQNNQLFIPQKNKESIFVQNYEFHHSTLQDFFAACHVKKMLLDNPKGVFKILSPLVHNPRYELLFSFLAGLLKDHRKGLEGLFSLLDNPQDKMGLYSLQLKIRCLEECSWFESLDPFMVRTTSVWERLFSELPKSENKEGQYVREIQSCCEQIFNPGVWQLIKKSVLRTFEKCPQTASKILFVTLRRALKIGDSETKRNAIHVITLLHFTSDELQLLLRDAFKDKAFEVREAAVFALSKMNENSFAIALSKYGVSLVEDSAASVRKTLALTLGKKSFYELPAAMSLLLSLLDDPVETVSEEAMNSLCCVKRPADAVNQLKELYKQKTSLAKQKRILTILGVWGRGKGVIEAALKSNDLRSSAIDALAKANEKLPKQLIDTLFKIFLTTNEAYVASVLSRLGRQNKDNAADIITRIEKIVNGFGLLIQNQPPQPAQALNINQSMLLFVQILGEVGENNTEHVLAILKAIEEISNYSEEIQIAIATAIGSFFKNDQFYGYKALKKVYLTSEFETVQTAAIEALTSFTSDIQHLWFGDIQSILVSSSSSNVRKAALDSLGENKYHNDLMKPALDIMLGTEKKDPLVRPAVIGALINIGQENPRKAVDLIRLIDKLTNEELSVFSNKIFEALGLAIQKKLSIGDLNSLLKFLYKGLFHQNQSIKIDTIKILPQCKQFSSEQIVQMLEIPISSESPDVKTAVIEALSQMPKGIRLKAESMKILMDTLTDDLANKETASKLLCRVDLSSHSNVFEMLMKLQGLRALNGTLLTDLIKQYERSWSESYLFAIVNKCLSANLDLFVQDGFLCFWEEGQLKQLVKENRLDFQKVISDYKKASLLWKAEAKEKNNAYAQAGYYYRKAGMHEKMIENYKRGRERLAEIHSSAGHEDYPELEECLDAVCSLGLCYQTGQELVQGRLKEMSECYKEGIAFDHQLSKSLYASLKAFHLIEKDPNYDQRGLNIDALSFPIQFHIFNLTQHAYMLDEESKIPPKGTIGLALASLEPTAINRQAIFVCFKNKQRADHRLISALGENDESNGDLIILLPETLAKNQKLMDKCLLLGLFPEPANERRECSEGQRLHTVKFVIPQADIERFLRDELHLTGEVYKQLLLTRSLPKWFH